MIGLLTKSKNNNNDNNNNKIAEKKNQTTHTHTSHILKYLYNCMYRVGLYKRLGANNVVVDSIRKFTVHFVRCLL